jgi:hypothetical protein
MSACGAWVTEVFSPVSRQPPATRSALVRMVPASDPAPGSVAAQQPSASPAATSGAQRETASLGCLASSPTTLLVLNRI